MSLMSDRLKLKDAAPALDVTPAYLRGVIEDRSRAVRKRLHSEATHERLLSDLFYKDALNGRWYISRTVLEKVVRDRNSACRLRDPQEAIEIRKRLERVL